MSHEDELRHIATVSERLAASHPELDRPSIDAAVREAHESYAGSRVRDYVPLLVERGAMERLALRQAREPA